MAQDKVIDTGASCISAIIPNSHSLEVDILSLAYSNKLLTASSLLHASG